MNKRLLCLALIFVLAVPLVQGAAGASFGTQVNKGDSDFIPVAKKALAVDTSGEDTQDDNHRLKVLRKALGGSEVTDDVFILDLKQINSGADAGVDLLNNVDYEDALLTPYDGHGPGYLVRDTDTVLKGAASAAPATVLFADTNNDGKYKTGDYVFLVSGTASAVLMPTTGVASWTIRLTETPSGPAGSFVFASDADFTSYQNAVGLLGLDITGADAAGTAEKRAYTTAFEGAGTYLIFKTDAAAAAFATTDAPALGSVVPRHSIRLTDAELGSQVNKGDADFVPVAKKASVGVTVLRKALGGSEVTDDAFYFDVKNVGTNTVDYDDLRLTAGPGGPAGSSVVDADTIEKGAATVEVVGIVYADVDHNGRYDLGDHLFIGQNGAATAITTATGLAATTGPDMFTIRLTETPSGPAGSLVFAGDADFVAYRGAVTTWGGAVGEFEGADWYLAKNAFAAGATPPQYAVRIADEDQFGSVVRFGDADFRPTLLQAGAPTDGAAGEIGILRAALGGSEVTDDCVYVNLNPLVTAARAGQTLDNFDIRATSCQGMAPGTLIGDADTVEKSNAVVDGFVGDGTVRIQSADLNNDGKYKTGDDLYLTVGAAAGKLVATTGPAAYTVRLTETPAGPAGSFVFASDSDFVSYANAVTDQSASFKATFFDADLSGTQTGGDLGYLAYKFVPGTSTFVPRHSVRLSGDLEVTPPAPSAPSTTTTSTTAVPTTTTTTTTTTTAPATHTATITRIPDPAEAGSATTPGFGMVALIAALGAALALVRRR